ncbi:hypothetical protein [Oceanobacillus halotolerans]|uniref:hypothetical protein n=1 Tax=Oceanobacillus halotolerans TaxID=2663380 RepID=UPI0013DC227A|nr:hypothetical protein [Oceanobacillus halotolerans]
MKKWIMLGFLLVGFGLSGCAQATEEKEDQEEKVEEKSEVVEKLSEEDLTSETVVAQIGDYDITGEDVLYEMKRLEVIAFLGGYGNEEEEISPNVAIQELIRNQMIHEIAEEEGVKADESEQEERAASVRQDVESYEEYEQIMDGIDVEEFWSREQNRYEVIIEAEQLIVRLMENVEEEHPDYDERALRFDAQENLEELIQERLVDVEVDLVSMND